MTSSLGVPRYWATVWESLHGRNVGEGTLGQHLRAIERFYISVLEQTGQDCLDVLLAQCDFEVLEGHLEGFFVSIQNAAAQSQTDGNRDWRLVLEFVRDIVERQFRSLETNPDLDVLHARLLRLERLYATLNVSRRPKRAAVRALPASVVENLYELTDPTSAQNPFQSDANKWRNYALFLLYLHQGLRRGEALILPVDALKEERAQETGATRKWLDVIENEYEVEDQRYEAPRIKTTLSRRQIPIADSIADIIAHYSVNYRRRQNHSFLFPSNRKHPLSVRSVNNVFHVLSAHLSDGARKDLRNCLHAERVTPHDCRHTCAVVRLSEFIADGMEMDLAIQNLRVFFGWVKDSEMPRHYARAYFEDRLRTVWQKKFDDRVDLLRTLRQIEINPEELVGDWSNQ